MGLAYAAGCSRLPDEETDTWAALDQMQYVDFEAGCSVVNAAKHFYKPITHTHKHTNCGF